MAAGQASVGPRPREVALCVSSEYGAGNSHKHWMELTAPRCLMAYLPESFFGGPHCDI